MATVERVSGPTVGVERIPNAMMNARLDPNHTAGLVRGIQTLGAGLAAIAEKEQQKAAAASILEAKRKLGDWERTWFDPKNPTGVHARKGRDALGLVDEIDPEFERVQGELAGGLKDERAREAFLGYAQARRESMLDRVNGYAVGENDRYVESEFNASVLNTAEQASQAALDERWNDQAMFVQDGLRTIRAKAALDGEAPVVTEQRERAFYDTVHSTAVNGYLAKGDTMGAATYLHDNADALSATAVADLTARLRPQLLDAAAYALVDGIEAGVSPADSGATVGFDSLWAAVEHRESRGRQSAVSPKGAVGVAQVMPATGPIAAALAGIAWDPEKFKNDAGYNRALGQAYLREQERTFGAAPLALAAYNAGPGRVSQWIQRFGDPRKGEISMADFVARIPFKETREYVQAIMGRVGGGGGSGGSPASASPAAGAAMTVAAVTPGAEPAVPALPPNATLEEKLASLRGVEPAFRERAEARLRQQDQDRRNAEADREREVQKAIYQTVNNLQPGEDWRSKLPPDQRAYADQHNLSPNLDAQVERQQQGRPQVTPPDLRAALDKVILDASTGHPAGVKAIREMRPYDPRLTMAQADRDRIAALQVALAAGDQKAIAASATDAEVGQTVSQFRRTNLGIDDQEAKYGAGLERATMFEQELRTWISDESARRGGKKPSYREIQERADQLTFAVPASTPGRIWGYNVEDVPAMDITSIEQIPVQYRTMLRAAFPDREPTDAELIERYIATARAGKLPK